MKDYDSNDIKSMLIERAQDRYILLDASINTSRINILCTVCNKKFKTTVNEILHCKCICTFCRKKAKDDKATVYMNILNEYSDEYEFGETANSNKANKFNTFLNTRHKKCGNYFHHNESDIFNKTLSCPYCSHNQLNIFREFLSKKHATKFYCEDKRLILTDDFCKIDIYHKECGNIFECSLGYFKEFQRCPYCDSTKDTGFIEKDIASEIRKFYKGKIIMNDSETVPNMELDIYLPDVKVAIEVNSLKYHSERFGRRGKFYHLSKTIRCQDMGIELLHIFLPQWDHSKQDIIRIIKNFVIKRNWDIKSTTVCVDR